MEETEIGKATRIVYLIRSYTKGSLTADEEIELNEWRQEQEANDRIFYEMTDEDYIHKSVGSWDAEKTEASLERIKRKRTSAGKTYGFWIYASAAAIAILIAMYLYKVQIESHEVSKAIETKTTAIDVAAGRNRAVLTLANGRQIDLDSTGVGNIASEEGMGIRKLSDGAIAYLKLDGTETGTTAENTIRVPRGGQYSITLNDGTKVWLNAQSSLKYPVRFAGRERRVELSGEAYFEVAKNRAMPFIVKSARQQVEVLGTHFNVNSYDDEPSTVTTLEEGRVSVSANGQAKTLSPGQQTRADGKGLTSGAADMETALAWKNGRIEFRDADIRTIMRQVSRWYDIEVAYKGNIGERTFNGSMSRSSNLSALLKILEYSNIHFELKEGDAGGRKTLTVIP